MRRHQQSGDIILWKEGNEPTLWYICQEKQNVLVKSVYLTTMYRCDQDMIATLRIADMVLKEHIFH